jgi:hypothetical protein
MRMSASATASTEIGTRRGWPPCLARRLAYMLQCERATRRAGRCIGSAAVPHGPALPLGSVRPPNLPCFFPQAIESARKEAVTDGMKRALRHYGNALGLSVYNKQQVKETMRRPTAPPPAAAAPVLAQFSAPTHSPSAFQSCVAPVAAGCPPHGASRPAPAPPESEPPAKRQSTMPPHAAAQLGHAIATPQGKGPAGRPQGGPLVQVWPHQPQALPHPELPLLAPPPPLLLLQPPLHPAQPPLPAVQPPPVHSPPEQAAPRPPAPLPGSARRPPPEEFADAENFDAALLDFHC